MAVKTRWGLTVDATEKRALLARANTCPAATITVRLAATSTTSASSATQSSGTSTASTSASGNDPRFAYCYQDIAAGYGPYIRGRDPEYAWYTDSDGEGRVCE